MSADDITQTKPKRKAQSDRDSRPLFVFGFVVAAAPPAARAQQTASSAQGHVLVKTLPGVNAAALATQYGARVDDQVAGTTLYGFRLASNANVSAFITAILRDSRVVYAEADTVMTAPEVSGDPFHFGFDRSTKPKAYVQQASYGQIGFSVGSDGVVNPLSPMSTIKGQGVVVAVLDTGVSSTHPALQGHFVGNGYGYNALSPGKPAADVADGKTNSGAGHGTVVAGIIARLAPGAKILPVRVLNGDGVGTLMNVAKGLQYAVAAHARVINMSFSMSQRSDALKDALDAAEASGAVLVAAAGNFNNDVAQYPATGKGAIAVAALESNNVKSSYSSFGSFVRVSAPGSDIRSTDYTGGYVTGSGTSFAAPFVSAEAALLLSARPTLTAEIVSSVIRNTATPVDKANPKYKGKLGKGIINLDAAVRSVL